MLPVFLTKIKTRDGITLDGIYIKPGRKSRTALIWLHGLTSYFYSGQTLIKELSLQCQKNNIGYFKFNMRGHDVVVRGQGRNQLLGTLFEKFTDCIYDIKAMIRFARSLGYKNIIIAGHSTGANKAVYYLYKTRDRSVKKVILLGALSDIAAEIKRIGMRDFENTVNYAKRLYRKDPNAFFMSHESLYTARRHIVLHTPGLAEDTFPYYNPKANWKALKSIKIPLAVILGSRDEYLDRPAKNLIKIFREKAVNAKSFSGVIIKNAGHGFAKKEKELSKAIIGFVKSKSGL